MAYRALLVGVSEYEQLPSLAGPVQEVDLLEEVLRASPRSPFAPENILTLRDPTRSEAQGRLFDLLRGADLDDTLLFYFTGHAVIARDGDMFLLLANADPRIEDGGLAASMITAEFARTRASSVLFILNSSFAGAFTLPDSPRLKDSATSYYFIGSVGPTEPALAPSPFAGAIASGLQRSMAGGHGLVPEDLFSFVSERLVPEGVHPFFAARGNRDRGRSPVPVTAERHSIFISYAHKDAPWLNKLRPHLESLSRDVVEIYYWDDQRIRPGDDWQQEIRSRLNAARAAVLLVSADFLASKFIRNEELPALLSLAENRSTRLYCLIIRPCRFDKVAVLSSFQAVNSPDRTLSEMPLPAQERIFLRLTDQLEQALR